MRAHDSNSVTTTVLVAAPALAQLLRAGNRDLRGVAVWGEESTWEGSHGGVA